MGYYILTIILASYMASKRYRKLSFRGLLTSIGAFHLFGFLSLMMIAVMEVEPIKGLFVILIMTIILTLGSVRPPLNSKRWLWHKKSAVE